MGIYVVGDIHGHFNEWMKFKDKLIKQDSNAKFILVGDIIDRGRQTYEMLRWAMDNITNNGTYQMVLGNHEVEKINWWKKEFKPKMLEYKKLNKEITLDIVKSDRYNLSTLIKQNGHDYKFYEKMVDWLSTLPYYKDIIVNNRRYIIVHANLPKTAVDKKDGYSIKKKLDKISKELIVSSRDTGCFDKIPLAILVNGHVPTTLEKKIGKKKHKKRKVKNTRGKIKYTTNRFNVDCGLVYRKQLGYGNLAALRLEDLKEFYLYD